MNCETSAQNQNKVRPLRYMVVVMKALRELLSEEGDVGLHEAVQSPHRGTSPSSTCLRISSSGNGVPHPIQR